MPAAVHWGSGWLRCLVVTSLVLSTLYFGQSFLFTGPPEGQRAAALRQLARSVDASQARRDLSAISVHSPDFHAGHVHQSSDKREQLREDAEALKQQIEELKQQDEYTTCFTDLDEVLRNRAVNNTVVWTLANKGFSDFLLNLIVSWRLLAQPNYFVIALDPEAKRWLEHLRVPCFILTENLEDKQAAEFQRFLSSTYLKFMRAKPQYTLDILRRGYYQIYADADMVWLRDPMEFIENNPSTPEVNYWVQDDTYMPCGGFYWLRPNQLMEDFFTDQLANLERDPSQNEQYGQWDVMQAWQGSGRNLRWKYLPTELFPNGRVYFQWHQTQKANLVPYIVHTNWIVGRLSKIWRMRENGLWFLDDDDYYGADGASYLSVELNRGMNINGFRETLRNGAALAALLGRRFVVPLIACSHGADAAPPEDWCDLTNWQTPFANPKHFDIDDMFPKIQAHVPLVETKLLSDPRFARFVGATPKTLHIALQSDSAEEGADADLVVSSSVNPACGLRSSEVLEALAPLADARHIQVKTLTGGRFVAEGSSAERAISDAVSFADGGACAWKM